MTINISLTGMDLTAAGKEGVTALVNACMAFTGTSLGAEIEIPNAPRSTIRCASDHGDCCTCRPHDTRPRSDGCRADVYS